MKKLKTSFGKNITESTNYQIARKDEKKPLNEKIDTWYEIARDSWSLKPSIKEIDYAARHGRRL
jgi:hypothetical protein